MIYLIIHVILILFTPFANLPINICTLSAIASKAFLTKMRAIFHILQFLHFFKLSVKTIKQRKTSKTRNQDIIS
jgi:hypothetical protein